MVHVYGFNGGYEHSSEFPRNRALSSIYSPYNVHQCPMVDAVDSISDSSIVNE